MHFSMSSLFSGTGWNPLVHGFKKCKRGTVTRFIFVANSVDFGDTPNASILHHIFSKYGPLYNVFIVDDKPFANVAFVHIGDAIRALHALNGNPHSELHRKLHLDFSEPRYPKVECFTVSISKMEASKYPFDGLQRGIPLMVY